MELPTWAHLLPPSAQLVYETTASDVARLMRDRNYMGITTPAGLLYRWVVDQENPYYWDFVRASSIESRTLRIVAGVQKLREARGRMPPELWNPVNYPVAYQVLEVVRSWLRQSNLYSLDAPSLVFNNYALREIDWDGFRDMRGITPMGWFMRYLFLPVLTMIDRDVGIWRATQRAVGPRMRTNPVVFVSMMGPNGRTWTYRISHGLVFDVWRRLHLEDADFEMDEELLGGSGLSRAFLHLSEQMLQVSFAIRTYTPQPRQARMRHVGILPLVNVAPGIDVSRYQVFSDTQFKDLKPEQLQHCLIYALKLAGVPAETVRSVAGYIPGRMVHLAGLKKVFEKANLHVVVTYAENSVWKRKATLEMGPATGEPVQLGLIENHVFVNELCPISLLYVKHCLELPPNAIGYTNVARLNHGVPEAYYEEPVTWSFDVLNHMYHAEVPLLRVPGYYDTCDLFRKSLPIDSFGDQDLKYDARISTKEIVAGEEREKERPTVWFGDFETFTTGEVHQPFLLCYGKTTDDVRSLDCVDFTAAIWAFLNDVGEGLVYFHNLAYDGTFILGAVKPVKDSIVELSGSKIIAFKVTTAAGVVEFRDSLAIMPFALRKFPAMLGVEVEKEIFPYRAYSAITYRACLAPGEVLELDNTINEVDLKNAAIRAAAWDGERIDLWKYAVYYCARDVEVLLLGFGKMDAMMAEATGQHLWERLTAPSLAFHSLRLKGVFEGCFRLCGAPAEAIRRTVVGGRCMLARNLKQLAEGPIADFDAVSLYPSAMSQLYTLKGIPKVLEATQIADWEAFSHTVDGFFIEIDIERVGRALDFPLISRRGVDGNREFCNEPGVLWVDDITLHDLCEFHQITYRVIRGYYFNDGKNYAIRDVIKELFDLRLRAKADKQPIETVYKLLMNSCYGKTIMKPRETHKNVMTEDELLGELEAAPFTVVAYQKLPSGLVLARTGVDVLDNWSIPTFGAHILAMSKRIMTRVTSLAQDLGIPVYYTDTDSIHIQKDALPTLAEAFGARYGQELIGKKMLQMHSDFPSTSRGMMWSQKFIGVGKKAYLDVLTDGVETRYHIRLKGVPEAAIHSACRRLEISVEELYRRFYEFGDYAVDFDLCDAKPMFDRKANLTIATLTTFIRRLSFRGLKSNSSASQTAWRSPEAPLSGASVSSLEYRPATPSGSRDFPLSYVPGH